MNAAAKNKNIQTFLNVQRELQKIHHEFPLQYSICLAEIAVEPGISLTELSKKASMPLSTVSRIAGALSTHRQKGKPFELVEVKVSPEEKRRKQLYLTKRGENVINSIVNALKEPDRERLSA